MSYKLELMKSIALFFGERSTREILDMFKGKPMRGNESFHIDDVKYAGETKFKRIIFCF